LIIQGFQEEQGKAIIVDNKHTKHRIAHIITSLESSESEMMLYKLLAHADRSHCEPIVISLDQESERGDRITAHGIPVHFLNMKGSINSSWHILRLTQLLRQLQPDILHGWMYQGNLAAALANRLLANRYPLIWNIHQAIDNLQDEPFMSRHMIQWGARLSKKTNRIVYNAYSCAEQHELIGYSSARTQVIPNGFDTYLFRPHTGAGQSVRHELGIPPDAFVIGMMTRGQADPNYPLFLAAASFIHQHHPHVHFVIAGENATQDNPELVALRAQYKLGDNLHLLGERKDATAVLNALDIFSLTSSNETFPGVIGEAMACGIPCITPDTGDLARIIGNTGTVIENISPSSLAFTWLEWLDAGQAWRSENGQRAIQRIQKHYTIGNITAQYQELYQELLNQMPCNKPARTHALG
jgi:glycosyltransferase involved in cell wall biosynthesis